jgi:hypothetical protein
MRAVLGALIILVGIAAVAHADGPAPVSKQCNASADAQSKTAPEDIAKQLSGCKSGDLMLASFFNVDLSSAFNGAGTLQQAAAATLCDYRSTILATKDGPIAFITCIKR